MQLTIKSTEQLKGQVDLPASKSYSIRAFMVGASGGVSQIIKPSNCDDALVAMHAARALGCHIHRKKDTWHLEAFKGKSRLKTISVGESGTVLRLLLPMLSLHCKDAIVTGQGTLIGRPNLHLLETLRAQGLNIHGHGKKESVPIKYSGGQLKSGLISIDGSLSSQFVSALLMTSPRLKESSKIVITGKTIVSKDYITMTLQILKNAGVKITGSIERGFIIKGKQIFKGLKNFTVPSDYGLAAFLMAAATLTHSDVKLCGYFDDHFIQADGHILNFLKRMGATFSKNRTSIQLNGPYNLKGGDFSLQDCPDLVPIMAVLALFAKGRTILRNIHHARAKESDRISDLRYELLKIGAKVQEKSNALIIDPLLQYKSNITLNPHYDHRLAMAFAVLGLKIGLSVQDMQCSHKSYPDFVRDFKSLGAHVTIVR